MNGISRRQFVRKSFGFGTGLFFLKSFGVGANRKGSKLPIIVTSHTNNTGQEALKAGWEILAGGGSALDAVERATNIIELDPEDVSVGFGGLPNEEGVVQLDASIMDGSTYNAGAVASLESIKTPSSLARVVMEKTDHVLLVGDDALKFARKWGFKEENLLTEKARNIWLRWKNGLSENDDWGPPEHLQTPPQKALGLGMTEEKEHHYGTTNVLAVDQHGHIAGITSTSGLAFKIPGRVGDSPIIGAGLYVDNEVGAAGATGRGEDVIKSCASFYIVLGMKQGRTPQQACEDAVAMIVEKYRQVNPAFSPSEKFVAVNKKGEVGCAGLKLKKPPRMSIMNADGYTLYPGKLFGNR